MFFALDTQEYSLETRSSHIIMLHQSTLLYVGRTHLYKVAENATKAPNEPIIVPVLIALMGIDQGFCYPQMLPQSEHIVTQDG